MKRQAEHMEEGSKKRARPEQEASRYFRDGLFDEDVRQQYTKNYAESKPYKHGVISNLITPSLLFSVRTEVQASLSFTPKETDIYKIHQSGDLANLDGLDDSSLARLPSLLKLRDALYSPSFRSYLASVTASGPLSGRKTDMAINVYTPGSHLLCHDDVIGSRRVSYILYLTDPEKPWKAEWGGALRLYPTANVKGPDGEETKQPSPDFTVSIPPAFNQLSFFAVQPGESFHDVEEVYSNTDDENGDGDEARVRMAISGWYHIPQEGEVGYVEGLEEKLAEKSSLTQLQGKGDALDLPAAHVGNYEPEVSEDEQELSEQDLDLLLQYMAPTYLTPDTLEELSELFAEESSLRLETFLSEKFAKKLRDHVERDERLVLPSSTGEIERRFDWKVARPPHKHRFLFQQPRDGSSALSKNPLQEVLEKLLPSTAFKKWLSLATGLELNSYNVLARRFRRGCDYTLATPYEQEGQVRLEITLGVTPTLGWGDDEGDEAAQLDGDKREAGGIGGYEVYMAGDDDDSASEGSEAGAAESSTKKSTKAKADPAVYNSKDEGDDGVLFSMPAGWNTASIVLRDQGVLKFVKYVSRAAKGDRWDFTGEFGVTAMDDDDESSSS
ncbi:MAG: hypothetical protein M1832_001324 [Thelocarpon impressellum]|nr:MAG: hypothetical protein M1832_001324 [Thelocarpon impressellum]